MSDFNYLEKPKTCKVKYKTLKYVLNKCNGCSSLLVNNILNKYLTKLSKEDLKYLKEDIYTYRDNILKFLSSCSFVFLYFDKIFNKNFLDFVIDLKFNDLDEILELDYIIEKSQTNQS